MIARPLRGASRLAAVLAVLPRVSAAAPHKVLVLQTEGRAPAAVRAEIDGAIARLALVADPEASAGELTFTDAATAVGCKPEAPACKDEVLAMLAVDEIVTTTVAPKPGGLEISVRRIARGGATREASLLLPSGAPADHLDGIVSLFSARLTTAPVLPTAARAHRTPASRPPPARAPAPPPPVAAPAIAVAPPSSEPAPAVEPPAPPPPAPPPPPPVIAVSPPASGAPGTRDRRLEILGMAAGGGMAAVGVALWAAAKSVQHDIDAAPTTTGQDLTHLRGLESRADRFATAGNVLVATGAIVAGVATYFFFRDRRGSAAQARIAPAVLDHGAGVVVTLGDGP